MGITISHRVRKDVCEAARFNSRRFLMERNAAVAEAGRSTNQITQWNTVLFVAVKFTVVLKCLRKNQQIPTSLSWSSLKALLIATSMFAICVTTRFASIVQSTRIPDTAMPVIQRSLEIQFIDNETTRKAIIPRILHRCVRCEFPRVCCERRLRQRSRV